MDELAFYQLVGERVRAARVRRDLSQEKLAGQIEMSRTSVVNIEAGRQRPPLHVLWRLAEELGTEVALLLPTAADYKARVDPVVLDNETVREIEAAAEGDAATRRDLAAFIGRARRQSTSGDDEIHPDEAS